MSPQDRLIMEISGIIALPRRYPIPAYDEYYIIKQILEGQTIGLCQKYAITSYDEAAITEAVQEYAREYARRRKIEL